MRFTYCAILFLAAAGLVIAEDKIDPAKLIGKWQDKNPEKKGETVVVEFTKDGNVKVVTTFKGKEKSLEGTYKVDGDKLTMKVHPGNKKKTTEKVVTIDKLTDDEFVHTDDAKTTKTFAKAKATAAADTPKTDTPKTDAPKTDAPKTDAPNTSAPKAEPLPKGKLAAPDFKLGASEYATQFAKDFKGAQTKYKGKIVELNGEVVLTMGPSFGVQKSSLSITTPDPKDPFPPSVICNSDDPEFFSRAGRGQIVRIRGKVGQFGSSLESAELVEVGPDKRVAAMAEAMAKEFTDDFNKALQKYISKSLIVTGTVAAIKPDPKLKVNYVELKGDGKIAIECQYKYAPLVDKLKVGDTVKLHGDLTTAEKSRIVLFQCCPLK